jgi:hypothetical protein
MNEDGTKARGIIAILAAITFLVVIVILFYFKVDTNAREFFLLMLGALIAKDSTITQFYFGSSSGAKTLVANQQQVASELAKKVVPVVPVGAAMAAAGPTGMPDDPVAVTIAEDDPGHTSFKELAKRLNPDSTDEQIAAAWAALKASRTDEPHEPRATA